jgi:hypothetical protein
MPKCPNGCSGSPVLVKATSRFHGNTTNTWECSQCGERWTEEVSGYRAMLGPASIHGDFAAAIHDVTRGANASITAAREYEDEDE